MGLIRSLLQMNPRSRISSRRAKGHTFLDQYPRQTPMQGHGLSPPDATTTAQQ